ncbi:MAG: ABC transporter substrate-binding protein [Chloroflexi bacterium]|nr:ABC transporter substrate-binding protein [Chloroflexota bacterium]
MLRPWALVAIVGIAALALAACSDDDKDGPTIRAAGFNFAESHILSWIYAIALEEEGFPVDTSAIQPGSTREIIKPALESGQLDYVPEYVGTLLSFLGGEPTSDSAFNHAESTRLYAANGVTVLGFAPAQDTNAFVVTAEFAAANNLTTISDLVPIAGDLVFGAPAECPERPFCLIGLRDVYGVDPGEFVPLDGGARVTALREGAINLALLFSTQAVIADEGWVVLEDDRALEPAENIAMAVRNEIVEEYGDDFVDLINEITAKITTAGLTELNKQVEIDKEDAEDVARDWLEDNDFI